MPGADTSKWTPLEELAKFLVHSKDADYQSGSLVTVVTRHGETKYECV